MVYTPSPFEPTMTTLEAASVLGYHPSYLWKLIAKGIITPAVRGQSPASSSHHFWREDIRILHGLQTPKGWIPSLQEAKVLLDAAQKARDLAGVQPAQALIKKVHGSRFRREGELDAIEL